MKPHNDKCIQLEFHWKVLQIDVTLVCEEDSIYPTDIFLGLTDKYVHQTKDSACAFQVLVVL